MRQQRDARKNLWACICMGHEYIRRVRKRYDWELFRMADFGFHHNNGDTTPGEASINAQTGQEYTITATTSGITAAGSHLPINL